MIPHPFSVRNDQCEVFATVPAPEGRVGGPVNHGRAMVIASLAPILVIYIPGSRVSYWLGESRDDPSTFKVFFDELAPNDVSIGRLMSNEYSSSIKLPCLLRGLTGLDDEAPHDEIMQSESARAFVKQYNRARKSVRLCDENGEWLKDFTISDEEIARTIAEEQFLKEKGWQTPWEKYYSNAMGARLACHNKEKYNPSEVLRNIKNVVERA